MFHHHKQNVYVNGILLRDILIDDHVFDRHGESITEEIILKLVSLLQHQNFIADQMDENGFQYFVTDGLRLQGKLYRMVWLLPPDHSYLGVRTAFRSRNNGK